MKVRKKRVNARKFPVSVNSVLSVQPRLEVESVSPRVASATPLHPTQQRSQSLSLDLPWVSIGVSALVLLAAGSAVADHFSPAEKYYRQQQAQARIEQADSDLLAVRERTAVKQADEQLTQERATADDRYQSGCTVLAVERAQGNYELIAISDDTSYLDRALSTVLAAGEIVCDDNGITGRMGDNGQVTEIARSGNMDLVNTRIEDAYGWANTKRSTPGR